MTVQTVHVLGAGGGIVEMSLPLHEAVADQITSGHARIVNRDGTPIDEVDRPTGAPTLRDSRPALNAVKGEWVSWAVFNGADPSEVEALTKQDLIERYGQVEPGGGRHVDDGADPATEPPTDGEPTGTDPATDGQ